MQIPQSRRKAKKKHTLRNFIIILLSIALIIGSAVFAFSLFLDRSLSLGNESESTNAALSDAVVGRPFYTLVLGSDSREGSGTSDRPDESGDQARSDVMILVRVDAPNDQITMLTIPRDTPVTHADGRVTKINECYNIGGAAYTIEKVSELVGVPISHYVELQFSNLEEVVDALGGIEMDVPVDLGVADALTGEYIQISAGTQVLNGQQAQAVARARHEYVDDQDANRQSTVRELGLAILNSVVKRPIYEVPGAVLTAAQFVRTDMRTFDLIPIALSMANGSSTTIYSGTGPYAGGNREDLDGLWLCYDNPTGWKAVMDVVDSGGDPSTVDVNAGAIVP